MKTLPKLTGRDLIIDDRNLSINYNEIDWCIGGKSTYQNHCHRFTELHISHINDMTIGDTKVPVLKNISNDCEIFHYYFDVD